MTILELVPAWTPLQWAIVYTLIQFPFGYWALNNRIDR